MTNAGIEFLQSQKNIVRLEGNELDQREYLGYGFRHEACERGDFAAAVGSARSDQATARIEREELGIFYCKSKAFLHFHEDPAGLFADISSGDKFRRYPVNSTQERHALLMAIDRALEKTWT